MSKSQNPAIYIDATRNRVRIFKRTIRQLGNPAYIQLLVNPVTQCIAVLPSDATNKSLSHKVNLNTRSYEINSKFFVEKLLELYSPISHFNKVKIEGHYSEAQNTAFFPLMNAVCISDVTEDIDDE